MRSGNPLATLALCTGTALQAQGIKVPATVDTLSNGLRIIIHEDASVPIVTVNIQEY